MYFVHICSIYCEMMQHQCKLMPNDMRFPIARCSTLTFFYAMTLTMNIILYTMTLFKLVAVVHPGAVIAVSVFRCDGLNLCTFALELIDHQIRFIE